MAGSLQNMELHRSEYAGDEEVWNEKRMYSRKKIARAGVILRHFDERRLRLFPSTIVDISLGGAKITTNSDLKAFDVRQGDIFDLIFKSSSYDQRFLFCCRVQWIKVRRSCVELGLKYLDGAFSAIQLLGLAHLM